MEITKPVQLKKQIPSFLQLLHSKCLWAPHQPTQLGLYSDSIRWGHTPPVHPDICRIHILYDSDTFVHTHLYEAELSPAENIADWGKRCYSQQEKQAKSQNPHRVERVIIPGNGIVKLWCFVFFDLKGTIKTQHFYHVRSIQKFPACMMSQIST